MSRRYTMAADKELVLAISAIMERAYRRGAQQAIYLSERDAIEWPDLADWRFGKTLKMSLGLDGFTTTALERLFIEEMDTLADLGIFEREEV